MSSGIYLEFLDFIEMLFDYRLILFLLPSCATTLKYSSNARMMKSGSLSVLLVILRNSENIDP